MELDLNKILSENWVIMVFLIIALGSLLAKIRIGGVALGSTAGVLIVGLLFGHLGFPKVPGAATFGPDLGQCRFLSIQPAACRRHGHLLP